jgi:hypothetical protein
MLWQPRSIYLATVLRGAKIVAALHNSQCGAQLSSPQGRSREAACKRDGTLCLSMLVCI